MFTRSQIVQNLAQMRRDWEAENGLTFEAECLLFDTCQALGLSEAETQQIVGAVALDVIETTLKEGLADE